MNKEEITELLEKFYEYLIVSNPITDMMYSGFWSVVRLLAFFTDSLEGITDNILLLKYFYQNEDIANFVETLRPFFYILLALSIAYAGFLLIFQKKFDREGMIVNIFIACTVVILLSAGMDKAGEFTDAAVEVMKVDNNLSEDDAKFSEKILKQGVTDLMMFDKNEWTTTELDERIAIPANKLIMINPTERFTEKDTELKLSDLSKEVSSNTLTSTVDGFTATKLDQSGFKYNNEYYFRYKFDWVYLFVTMGVVAFTLLSISIKLAKLFFELAFNYVLATVIAPSDVYDGQKTKKVIQSILNIFIVTILIFMSLKVYMIGMVWLTSLDLGIVTYLIALFAFSLGVLDAPNIIERLYGIDGGLKSGWGLIYATHATMNVGRGVGHLLTNQSSNSSSVNTLSDSISKSHNNSSNISNSIYQTGGNASNTGNTSIPRDSNNNSQQMNNEYSTSSGDDNSELK